MRNPLRSWQELFASLGLIGPTLRRVTRRKRRERRPQRHVYRRARFEALEARVVLDGDPIANDDYFRVSGLATTYISAPGVLANDTYDPNASISVSLDSPPGAGSLSLSADGGFSYSPPANTPGNYSFNYHLNDGAANSNTATVTLHVNAVPIGQADEYTVGGNQTLTIGAGSGVLANDSDADDSLTAVLVSGPMYGSVTLNADGSFSYSSSGFLGDDSFVYRASDSLDQSGDITVTIHVVNSAPAGQSDSYRVAFNGSVSVDAASGVLANDSDTNGDSLTAILESGPSQGSLTLNSDGSFSYTAPGYFTGSVSFSYRVSDGTLTSDPITVTLVVNTPPVAGDASSRVSLDNTSSGTVPASDADSDPLTVTLGQDAAGDLTLHSNGTYQYTPIAVGQDGFSYTVHDGLDNGSGPGTVTLNVNTPASVGSDYYSISVNSTLYFTITASDADNDSLSVNMGSPQYGSVYWDSGTQTYVYTPNAGYVGEDAISFAVSDGYDTRSGTITIYVNDVPPNVGPSITAPGSQTVSENSSLYFNSAYGNALSISDPDAGGNPVEITLSVDNGSISIGSSSGLSFTNGGTGTSYSTIGFYGTVDDINSALGTLAYAAPMTSGSATLSISVNDLGNTGSGGAQTASGSVAITIETTTYYNQGPSITAPSSASLAEGNSLTFSGGNGNSIYVGDPDAGSNSVQVTLSVDHGTLTLATITGLSITTGDGTEDETITFTGLLNDINAALEGLVFAPGSYVGSVTLTIDMDDLGNTGAGGALTASAAVAIEVEAIDYNDAPSIDVPATQAVAENTSLVFSTANGNAITIADPDAASSPVQVTLAVDYGLLSLATTAGLSFISGDGSDDGTMTFSGALSDVNAALNGLTFNSTSFLGTATLSIAVDDLGNSGAGGAQTASADIAIDVAHYNQAPTISAPAGAFAIVNSTLAFTGGWGISVGDPDADSNPLVVTLSVTHGTMTISSSAGLFFSQGNSGGSYELLQFSGTITDLNDALAGLAFTPETDYIGSAILSISVNDGGNSGEGGALSSSQTVNLTVNPPLTAVEDEFNVALDGSSFVSAPGVLANDFGGQAASLSAELVTGPDYGTLSFNSDGSFTYDPGGYVGDVSFTYQAFDGVNYTSATATLHILPALSIDNVEVDESSGTATFTVTLSPSSNTAVTFEWATSDGTAVAGEDYVAASGSVTLTPGQTSATIQVSLLGADLRREWDESFTLSIGSLSGAVLVTPTPTATIHDNDPLPTIQLSGPATASITEGNAAEFTLTLSTASDIPVTVHYATQDGTAKAGSDYVAASGEITFAPGETTKTVSITTTDDTGDELDEVFYLRLSSYGEATAYGGQTRAQATLTDNDAPPVISIAAPTGSVTEGQTASFQVSLSAPSDREVRVNYYTQSETATAPADYTYSIGTLIFAPGEITKWINIATIDDSRAEVSESFRVQLANPVGASLSTTASETRATATIADNDANPTVSIGNVTVNEAAGLAAVTISLSAASDKSITVGWYTQDDTAYSAAGEGHGQDYQSRSGTLTFAPGVTSRQVFIPLTNDTRGEVGEQFFVELQNATNATIPTGQGTATVTVLDDDAPRVSAAPVTVGESEGLAYVRLQFTNPADLPVKFNWQTVSIGAHPATDGMDGDYVGGSGVATLAVGATTVDLPILINPDSRAEYNETFGIAVSTVYYELPGGGTQSLNVGATALVTIADDDIPEVSIDDATVSESAGTATATLHVSLSGPSDKSIAVFWHTTDLTATAGSDYTAVNGQVLTFAPGETEKTITVSIPSDLLNEPAEQFLVRLAQADNAAIVQAVGIVTINDNDRPQVGAASAGEVVASGAYGIWDATLGFAIYLTAPSAAEVTVHVAATGPTVTSGPGFYLYNASQDVTFAPGETVTWVNFGTSYHYDTDEHHTSEFSKTVTVTLSSPDNATLGASTATGTVLYTSETSEEIEYEYEEPIYVLQPGYFDYYDWVPIFEWDEATQTNVWVRDEWTGFGWNPEVWVFDHNETRTGTYTEWTFDNAPVAKSAVTIYGPAENLEEDDEWADFVILVSGGDPESEVSVSWQTGEGTATGSVEEDEGDYESASGSLTIAPNSSETVRVRIRDDRTSEVTEWFEVSVSAGSNAYVATPAAIAYIEDNDPTISIEDAEGSEADSEGGDGQLVFHVNLSRPASQPTVIFWKTVADTAVAGDDFVSAHDMLVFEVGQTSKTITIALENDRRHEKTEKFKVVLMESPDWEIEGGGGGGEGDPPCIPVIIRGTATGTITDDDPVAARLVPVAPAIEGNLKLDGQAERSGVSFTLTLDEVSDEDITVDWTTADGSARGGTDYVTASGTLTIAAGKKEGTITVYVLGNALREGDRYFTIELTNPENVQLQDDNDELVDQLSGFAEIEDDDGASTKRCSCTYGCGCSVNSDHGDNQTGNLGTSFRVGSVGALVSTYGDADGAPMVPVDATMPEFDPDDLPPGEEQPPVLIRAKLTLSGNGLTSQTTTVYYSADNLPPGGMVGMTLQADGTILGGTSRLPTGIYSWQLELQAGYEDDTNTTDPDKFTTLGTSHTMQGRQEVVNFKDSALGENWNLVGLNRLTIAGNDVLLVQADGQSATFRGQSGGYRTPAGYTSVLEKHVVEGVTTYTLSDKNRTVETYNASGQLESRADIHGNRTVYAYSGSRLMTMTDPLGRVTTFYYHATTGLLTSITDFIGRVTTFEHNAAGRLTSIAQPGPSGQRPTTTFAYDPTSGRLTGRTDAAGAETTYQYTAGKLSSITRPAEPGQSTPSVQTFAPALAAGAITQEGLASGTLENPALGSIKNPASFRTAGAPQTATQTDANGHSTSFTLDRFGGTTSVTTADGATTFYVRDAQGRVTAQINPDPDGDGPRGETATYFQYDTLGNLTRRTNPDGSVEKWEYDSVFSVVTRFEDALGRVTLTTLDQDTGNVLAVRQVVGALDSAQNGETDDRVTTYTYTSRWQQTGDLLGGLLLTVTDPLGNVTTYAYYDEEINSLAFSKLKTVTQAIGPLAAPVTTYVYSESTGYLDHVIDPTGATTYYAYDLLGQVTSTTLVVGVLDAERSTDPEAPADPDDIVTRLAYDKVGNVTSVVDPLGHETVYRYNATNQVVFAVQLPGLWTPEREVPADPQFDTEENIVSGYEYDGTGQLVRSVDALGHVTLYAFDPVARTRTITQVVGQVDGEGNSETDDVVTSALYDALGNLIVETDALGVETHYDYDAMNRVVAVTVAFGTAAAATTRREYDSLGRVTAIVDPLGRRTTFAYDTYGRWMTVTQPDPDGAGELPAPVTRTVFDALGRTTHVTQVFGVLDSTPNRPQDDPDDFVQFTEYDNLSRVIATTANYVPAVGEQPAPSGPDVNVTTRYAYDAAGRVTTVTLPDPDGAGARVSTVIAYAYDEAGRRTSETLAVGLPEEATTLYAYNAASNVTSVTDALGRVTRYEYDADWGRLASVVVNWVPGEEGQSAPTGVDVNVTTSYEYNLLGQVTAQTNPVGARTEYAYDALGRLQSVFLPDPATSHLAQATPSYVYAYNKLGQQTSITDPLGNVTAFAYNAVGYQTSVTEAAGTTVERTTEYQYDLAGQLVGTIDPLFRTTGYAYDALGRQTSITDVYGQTTAFAFNAVGNLTSQTDALGNATAFEYDALNRRTRTTDALGGETDFTFDAVGNLLSLTDPVENTTTWTYDGLGRQLTDTIIVNAVPLTRTFTYNAVGSLARAEDRNGREIAYGYDALNRRTREEWLDADGVTVTHAFAYEYNAASQLTYVADGLPDTESFASINSAYAYAYNNLGKVCPFGEAQGREGIRGMPNGRG